MMKNNKSSKGVFSLKLNIEKTYDIVKWNFLRDTMINIRFNATFVNLVMRCVFTVNLFYFN